MNPPSIASDNPPISKGYAWLTLARHAAKLYQQGRMKSNKTQGDAGLCGCFATLRQPPSPNDAEELLTAISNRLKSTTMTLSFSQRLALLELSLLIAQEHPQIKHDIQQQVDDVLGRM